MKQLHISPDLALPIQAVTETFGILAIKRVGKSNAGVVMAEEMYDAGLPWVAIDPKGDWWGVRAAADGKGPGLPVVVFGGEHGDVPLEETSGRLIADLVVDQRLTCVLDISGLMDTNKSAARRFLTDFAERLYARNREPLHVFCEEADEYIPQMVRGDAAKMVGAFERLVKRGGFRGIGVTLITQRSASLNKDVLTQIGTLIVLQTTSPQDRKAILGWVVQHALGQELVDGLPELAKGEAWVFSPAWLRILKKITFRRRRTFDSGATPEIGVKLRPPATLADVDLEVIRKSMAATIEKAKADDPRELRKRIQELERQLLNQQKEAAKKQVEIRTNTVEIVERVPIGAEEIPHIRDLVGRLLEASKELGLIAQSLDRNAGSVIKSNPAQLKGRVAHVAPSHQSDAGAERPTPRSRPVPPSRPVPSAAPISDGKLTGPEQRVLNALAWLEAVGFSQPTKIQIGFVADYRAGKKVGGTFGNVLGRLRSSGLIDYPSAGTAQLTEAGRAVAAVPDIEQNTRGLQAAFFARLDGPESRVLQAIVDAYPNEISKQDVGAQSGYAVGEKVGGTFGNILGRLRSLGLIDYPRPGQVVALPVLFLEDR